MDTEKLEKKAEEILKIVSGLNTMECLGLLEFVKCVINNQQVSLLGLGSVGGILGNILSKVEGKSEEVKDEVKEK